MICHDCKKELVKGDQYVDFGLKEVVKCKECFEKNHVLENYNPTEIYSRVVGFHTPINRWNKGKSAEWKDRKTFEFDPEELRPDLNVLKAPKID